MARPAPAGKGNRGRTIPYAASQLAATLRMLAPGAVPIVCQKQRGNEVPRKRYWMCSSVGGRTQRGVAGDGPDELEVGEGEDGGESREDHRERQQERPADVPERLPAARTVDLRGLVDVGGDGLQAGQVSHGEERDPAPDVGDHERHAG